MSILNECTYNKTSSNFIKQYWKHCYTCFDSVTSGACLTCVELCHKDHKLGPLMCSRFFCDCGHQGCKPKQIQPIQQIRLPVIQPIKSRMIQPKTPYNKKNKSSTHKNAINLLASKMDKKINDEYVLSPVSISIILQLLHIGSNGSTELELTNLFGRRTSTNELFSNQLLFNNSFVKMSNAFLFSHDLKINPAYEECIKALSVFTSKEDFVNQPKKISNKVNTFIEQNTNGLIKNLIDSSSINPLLKMLIINTIYFKAQWTHPFKKYNTFKHPFKSIIRKGECDVKKVDMMTQTNNFAYYEDSEIQMIEMNYDSELSSRESLSIAKDFSMDPHLTQNEFISEESRYSMGIILPKKEVIPSLDINKIINFKTNSKMKEVEIYLPKFTQRKRTNIIPILKKLNVKQLFTETAELEGIGNNLFVSNIIHEAIVIVDEEGTEASAATCAYVMENCYIAKKQSVVFKADHSFVYYIRDKRTNNLLFTGRI